MSNQIFQLCRQMPPLERTKNGAPYSMTYSQRKEAKELIRKNCCNYENGRCLLLDEGDGCVCPQRISYSICCKWFRYVILPADPQLEAEIFNSKIMKRCSVCGRPFCPNSNRGKYCKECGERMKRIKATERKRRQRASVTH